MKSAKKLPILLAALFLSAGLLTGSCITASAAAQVPKKIRIQPNSAYETFEMSLSEPTDKIRNIKTSSANLKAKETRIDIHVDADGRTTRNIRAISLYTAAEGKYTVSFDITDADNIRKAHKKVIVYAYSDPAFKEITLDGKMMFGGITEKASGRLKVTLNSGYKLKKIETGKYVKTTGDDGKSIDSSMKYTKIKNNSKITFSKVPYESSQENGSLSQEGNKDLYQYPKYYGKYWSKNLFARTEVRITYIDKYTKDTVTSVYYFHRLIS